MSLIQQSVDSRNSGSQYNRSHERNSSMHDRRQTTVFGDHATSLEVIKFLILIYTDTHFYIEEESKEPDGEGFKPLDSSG